MWDITTKERLIQPNKTNIHSLLNSKSPRPNKECSAYIHKKMNNRVQTKRERTETSQSIQHQGGSRQQLFV